MSAQTRELQGLLEQVRRRWLAAEGLLAAAKSLGACAALVGGAWGLSRLLGLGSGTVTLLSAAVLAASVAMLWTSVAPFVRRIGSAQIARYVEERCPEFEDQLVSAAEIDGRADPTRFQRLVVDEAANRLATLDLDRVVSVATVRRHGALALVALLSLAAAAFVARDAARVAWRTARLALFPPTLTLQVVPGDARVRIGEALEVVARVEGIVPGLEPGAATLVIGQGDAAESLEMVPGDDGFRVTVPRITKEFEYRVEVGRLGSDRFHVEVLRPARVTRIDLGYEYPAYSGLEARTEEDAGDIYGPEGTNVRVQVSVDKPVVDARMVTAKGEPRPLAPTADGTYETELVITEDGSYRIALADTDGLDNPGETEYFIRVMDDRPPEVRVIRPGGDRQVTRLEEVAIEVRADDDYGVDRLELVYAVRGGPERVVPLRQGPPETSVTGARTLFVEEFEVEPGDFVTYYARARDVGRGKKPSVAQSDIFFLEVRPFNEEFVSAQSQAMAGGGGQFDDLAAAQKDIIIATWKLERRSAAGRSDTDIRAVGRAQGELRAKTAQLAAQLEGGGRMVRRGGEPEREAGGGAMQAAVEAMGRAEEALGVLDTKGALPHEMDALNHLLRAQAENRRRQVAQQQNSGGGGGGERQNQDLSALFDRELLRQTETNYETPGSVEEREEKPETTLDKVRELARRQDELAERQRELARQQARMSAEELKRQLERLTREQAELQQQARQLSEQLSRGERGRQSGSEQSAGGQQSASGSQSGSGQMRQASEEMQGAAGDLRRADAAQAAARGEQALERLRDVERGLQHAQPDAQRRALGDLQAEAEQLAAAQRRLAEQTARLAGQAPDGDAARRLAGEQSRLAERVDELQNGLGRLGREAGERTGAAQAANDLERQGLSRRMRGSASTLRRAADEGGMLDRAGGPGSRVATEQRAFAEALDRVAERMAGALGVDRESAKLSEQLAELRTMRERLGELERQIGEVAAREASAAGGEQTEPGESTTPGEADSPATDGTGRSAARQGSDRGQEGRQGQGGGRGGSGELGRLQEEYARELRRSEQLMDELRRQQPSLAEGLAAVDEHTSSLSAPGTEAFKQDFARWDVLRRDLNSALDRLEVQLSGQLTERSSKELMNAGSDEGVPDSYRNSISEYYRALARKPPGKR